MACNSNAIILPVTSGYDGYVLSASNNAFNTMWVDKRSSAYASISISVSSQVDGATINPLDGYFYVQASNAPENVFRATFGSGPQLGVGLAIPADTLVVRSFSEHYLLAGSE
jgi:hypothetical protein